MDGAYLWSYELRHAEIDVHLTHGLFCRLKHEVFTLKERINEACMGAIGFLSKTRGAIIRLLTTIMKSDTI
jgi:hypothetical protein